MDAMAKIKKARLQIILDNPFFASLLLNLKTVPRTDIKTFGTDGEQLAFNPKFAESLNQKETETIIAHEILHCALGHIFRRGARKPKKWNVACDYVVDAILQNCNEEATKAGNPPPFVFTGPLKGGHLNPIFNGRSAEEIYNQLPDDEGGDGEGDGEGQQDESAGGGTGRGQPPSGKQKQKGDTQGDQAQEPPDHGVGEVLDAGGDKAQREEKEADWKVKTIQAASAAKARGNAPAAITRMVEDIADPSVPWQDQLRHFMNMKAKDEFSWNRPNKRLIGQGLYLPSTDGVKMGPVVVAIDTSGSIGDEILRAFQSEIQAILDECCPESMEVIYCDAAVNLTRSYAPGDLIDLKGVGGGGTAFEPVFEHVEEHGLDPVALIYLTDLMGSHRKTPPEYPVLWASIDKNGTAPWGEVIHVSVT